MGDHRQEVLFPLPRGSRWGRVLRRLGYMLAAEAVIVGVAAAGAALAVWAVTRG